jgi:sulfonate transport system permease protein
MIKSIRDKTKIRLTSIALPLLLLIIWQYVSFKGYVSVHLLPPPKAILDAFSALFSGDRFILDITFSLGRVLIGLLVGVLTGFLTGLLMGLSRTAEKMLAPFFNTIRQVPIIGWIPLIVMWFGLTETPRFVVISIAAFFPATLNTFEGVRGVSREYLELASVYGYRRVKLIRKIILPAALPSVITGITMSLAMAWELLVAAELLITTQFGVGRLISVGRERFKMELVLVGIVTVGTLGFLMTRLVEILGKAARRGNDFRQQF